jgi:hypothetical protein
MRQAIRIVRGAFATRAASSDAEGSSAPSHAPARTRRVRLAFAASALALLLIPGVVDAFSGHPPIGIFGPAAQPSFGKAAGLSVDQSNGDVLVIDREQLTVSHYHEDGTPANFSALGTNVIDGKKGPGGKTCAEGELSSCDKTPNEAILGNYGEANEVQVAVDNSGGATNGDVYVTDSANKVIDIFAPDGHYLGQLTASSEGAFGETCGVAVGPNGNVYVGDFSGKVHKFVSLGAAHNPLVNADNTANFAFSEACQVASGAGPTAGYIFAAHYNGGVAKLDSSTGAEKYVLSSGNNTTVSVNPTSGHVYVATGSEVKEYDASGSTSATEKSSISLGYGAKGVAVDETSGDVYVDGEGTHVEVFGPLTFIPEAVTGEASAITKHTATLSGNIDPSGGPPASCQFEYGPGLAQIATCLDSGNTIVGTPANPITLATDVHANLSNLQAGTTYPYRISTNNGEVTVGTVYGAERFFLTNSALELSTGAATAITSNSATLNGTVDPAGQPITDCHFDYGTTASYGKSVACSPAPSGSGAVAVHADLSGLADNTTYFFRLVATNADGTTDGRLTSLTTAGSPVPSICPNAALREENNSLSLPDCRAYEQVSPSGNDKNGANAGVNGNGFGATLIAAMAARSDGERVIWPSFLPYSGSTTGITYTFRSTRAAGGWTTAQFSPPLGLLPNPALANDSLIADTNEAMSAGVFQTSDQYDPLDQDYLSYGLRGTHVDVYTRNPDGSVTWVSRGNTNAPDAAPVDAQYVGRSANLDHVLFQTTEQLPGVPGVSGLVGSRALYDRSGGQTSLVNIDNAGHPISPCGAVLGAYDRVTRDATAIDNAVSSDGSRVAFTAPDPGASDLNGPYYCTDPSSAAPSQVYVREGNSITYDASASQRTTPDPAGTKPATYQGSSADGSLVFFTSSQALTNNAQPLAGGESGPFLYRYDVPTGQLALLTPNELGGPHVTGVVAVSADGAHVYFMRGGNELKMYAGGQIPPITLIATGPGQDSTQPLTGQAERLRGARLSPDGRYLLFAATNNLTPPFISNNHTELYLYHAGHPGLVCVSCNWDGHAPAGDAKLEGTQIGSLEAAPISRNVTNDGRAFFQSDDYLVREDLNHAADVYEWSDGALHLISTGHSPDPSTFIDSGGNGRDVFFATSQSLVPQDTDSGNFDAYDARVGGGFPPPTPPPAPCEGGETCHGAAPGAEPASPAFGSETVTGSGNPTPHHKKHKRHRHHRRRHHRRARSNRGASK